MYVLRLPRRNSRRLLTLSNLGLEAGELLLVPRRLEGLEFLDLLLKNHHSLRVGLYALRNLFILLLVPDLARLKVLRQLLSQQSLVATAFR